MIGKGVIFLSLGLLAEVFGQWAWSYFTMVQKIEVPYPSIADIGYFAIIPLYGYAMYNFAKASGVKIGLKSLLGKVEAVVIPLIMVSIAYFLFLKNLSFDYSNLLKTFFDFGYPGFEIIAVSLAILTYSLSRNISGGILKSKILFIVFALIFQYVTDCLFLYQVNIGTYYNGGIVDLMYSASFMIMALVLIKLNVVSQKIRFDNTTPLAVRPDLEDKLDTTKLFNQIVVEIIKRQEGIAGQIAWEEAKKVEGITVTNQSNYAITLGNNSKEIVDQLLHNYKGLFGDMAVEVSKNAVRYIVAELPVDQVPDSLK